MKTTTKRVARCDRDLREIAPIEKTITSVYNRSDARQREERVDQMYEALTGEERPKKKTGIRAHIFGNLGRPLTFKERLLGVDFDAKPKTIRQHIFGRED